MSKEIFLKITLIVMLSLFNPSNCAYEQWKDRVIYQIVTDRFKNGNTLNDQPSNYPSGCWGGGSSLNTNLFVGGDFAGITSEVDYIKSLIGSGSVWISPLYQQITTMNSNTCAYHGYWPDYPNPNGNYNTCSALLETHWGTNSEFTTLLNALQSNNMLFIQDQVPNHCGYGGLWPKNSPSDFTFSQCGTCSACLDCVNCEIRGLPDIYLGSNTSNSWKYDVTCQTTWLSTYSSYSSMWGIRMDAVRHMPVNFYTDPSGIIASQKALNSDLFVFGEHSYPNNICWKQMMGSSSQTGLTSMLNWGVFNNLGSLYKAGESAANYFSTVTSNYNYFSSSPFTIDTALTMVNFLDNHDQDRLFSNLLARYGSTTTSLLANAYMIFGMLMTIPGIPSIYYGTEIGMVGYGADSNRRNVMPDSSFGTISWVFNTNFNGFVANSGWYAPPDRNTALEINNTLAKAISIRNTYQNLRRGFYYDLWEQCSSPNLCTCANQSNTCSGCPFRQISNVSVYLRSMSNGVDIPTVIVLNNDDTGYGKMMIPVINHTSGCTINSVISTNDRKFLTDGTVLVDVYQQPKQTGLAATTISGGYIRPLMPNGKSISIFIPMTLTTGYCAVTFTVNAVYPGISAGQSVYLTGNIPELQNWGDWNAIRMNGTTSTSANITIKYLKNGTNIEFITLLSPYEPPLTHSPCDGTGWYLYWEKESNHSATVDCSNPNITFNHNGFSSTTSSC